jgi:hypothetical protein
MLLYPGIRKRELRTFLPRCQSARQHFLVDLGRLPGMVLTVVYCIPYAVKELFEALVTGAFQ